MCAAEKLHPEQVASLLPQILKEHVSQHDMDVPFMRRMLKEFVEQLDPAKSFFLKPEAEAIINMNDAQLKALAQDSVDGDFTQFKKILKGFLDTQIARDTDWYGKLEGRTDEIKALAKEMAKTKKPPEDKDKGTDKGIDNKTVTPQTDVQKAVKEGDDKKVADDELDPDKIKWTERPDTNEKREKRLLRATASLYSFNKSYLRETEAYKQAIQTIRQEHDKWLKTNVDDDVSKYFLKSFMLALDPHSDYLDADDEAEFMQHMERSFAGIGVQIRPCPLGAQVEDVIKGGPSDKSKKFARGDQIIAVDDVSLAGLQINKIVKLIKGEKGTDVKLTVLKRETQGTELVVIKRDTIELADLRVKGKTVETANGPIGLISVQAFYQGVHNDVRDRIVELNKTKPLAGVVLDLRFNTGGFLEEAIGLAGLFIYSGAVVGERDGKAKEVWQDDPDPSIAFAGPLVILTNQFSASASEIVTGTLKDYNRAVIVAHTQTFGKGTVQRLLSLRHLNLPGEIKVTTDQYFLASGSSVQLKGVDPDIVIPGVKLLDEEGYLERATPNAIPWSKIEGHLDHTKPEVKMWEDWKVKGLAMLQQKSKDRIDANPAFKDAFDPKKQKPKADAPETNEKPDALPPLPPEDKNEKDLQADEAAAICSDMVATWPVTQKAAAK